MKKTKRQKYLNKILRQNSKNDGLPPEYPHSKLGKMWFNFKDDLFERTHPYIVVRLSTETAKNRRIVCVKYLSYISSNYVFYSGLARKACCLTKSQAKTFKKLQGGLDDEFIFYLKRRDCYKVAVCDFEKLLVKTFGKKYLKYLKEWNREE